MIEHQRSCRTLCHRGKTRFAVLIAALLGSLVQPMRVWAGGTEYTRRAEDIAITVDSRWAGGMYGGYYPVRIRVKNNGKDRILLFRFRTDGTESLPRVERRITAQQNTTQQFTLPIPLVSGGSYGQLEVLARGRVISQLGGTISLPEPGYYTVNCPSLLVVSAKSVDCDQFEKAVNAVSQTTPATSRYYGSSRNESTDHEVVPPTMLPRSWRDYSGLDIVAMSLKTLRTIPESARSAVLAWVRTGGKLIVYDAGQPAAQSKELSRLLAIDQPATGLSWTPAEPAKRKVIVIPDSEGGALGSGLGAIVGPAAEAQEDSEEENPAAEKQKELDATQFVWPESPNTFSHSELMFGHVFVFPGNPFPGSTHDWAWLLNSLSPDTWRWTARMGISSRQPHGNFLEFMIPGVEQVPRVAFLLLITVFTVVIGPLNYLFLKRRRQLYLLVVTIPTIAFVTSASLFGYAAIAHGFGVKSRARSLTMLDQRNNTAVSFARIALYAGIAPSGGLKFSPETAIHPVWAPEQEFDGGRVDWSDTQHLSSGWIRSRTMTQFVTVSHRQERGRLEFRPAESQLEVANGFEWRIDTLLVADERGRLFLSGAPLPAGSSGRLQPTTEKQAIARLKMTVTDHPLIIRRIESQTEPYTRFGGPGYDEVYTDVDFTKGLIESRFRGLFVTKVNSPQLQPRSYIAVLAENPGIELGVESTDARGDFHVILGRY